MNKKTKLAFGGLGVSAVVAGVALTGGTSAYFYDLERSEGNSASACSLDLVEKSTKVVQTGFAEGGSQSQAAGIVSAAAGGLSTVSLSSLQPGDAFQITTVLKNNGSCAGELWGDINFPITDNENSILEPEAEAGDTSDGNAVDPGTNDIGYGELDDVMEASYTDDSGNTFNGQYRDLAYVAPYFLDEDFKAGENFKVVLTMTVPDDGTARDGNEIMGDSFTFAVDFAAAQKNKLQPRPVGNGLDLNNPN